MSTPDERPGLAKLRDAFISPSRGQFLVALLLFALAFAAVTQVNSRSKGDPYAGLRQDDLIQALNGLTAATDRSEADIDELQDTRDQLSSASRRDAAAQAQATKEVDALGILAGTAAASGPGITITVSVSADKYHANSLLDGIEELRDAGAEAIQINDAVRVIASTSFKDSDGGGGLVVDGRELSPPYKIDVIGDPDTLATALGISGGFSDDVAVDGGKTDVAKKKKVVVDVTRQPTRPRYIEQPDN